MGRLELDFLRQKPVVPAVSWLLLVLGIAAASTVAWRYASLQDALQAEHDRAQQLAREARGSPGGRLLRTAKVDPDQIDHAFLGTAWGNLFLQLERSRPDQVAFLNLEADGRKSQVVITAEAKSPSQMLDYLDTLRKQPGFTGVTLTSHVVDDEQPQRPVQFMLRLNWGQP